MSIGKKRRISDEQSSAARCPNFDGTKLADVINTREPSHRAQDNIARTLIHVNAVDFKLFALQGREIRDSKLRSGGDFEEIRSQRLSIELVGLLRPDHVDREFVRAVQRDQQRMQFVRTLDQVYPGHTTDEQGLFCLLYTSDAADE